MPRRVAAVNAIVIAIKGGHTKYNHLQRLHYSYLKVYTRNQYLLLNSSAIIISKVYIIYYLCMTFGHHCIYEHYSTI